MGKIKIPSAPAAFSFSITFQKSFSLITECTDDQPSLASGTMVGLLMPGKYLQIVSKFSFGAFSNTYLVYLAFFTERMRNNSWSSSSCLLLDKLFPEISTASDFKMI